MSVSSVSLQEISAARRSMPAKTPVSEKAPKQPKQIDRYVDRFSDKKIADFFAPYGYISHERNNENGSITVYCGDCQIIFDDFTLLAGPMENPYANPIADFNFNSFSNICELANMTPSQAISDRLEEEVFNGMPYYIDRKRKFAKNNLNKIVKNTTYRSLIAPAIARKNYSNDFPYISSYYGTTDPEKMADTIARVNSRN